LFNIYDLKNVPIIVIKANCGDELKIVTHIILWIKHKLPILKDGFSSMSKKQIQGQHRSVQRQSNPSDILGGRMFYKALDGTKVLEYGNSISGPFCAKILADLGAEVIKIEEPCGGDTSRKRSLFSTIIPVSRIAVYSNILI